VSGLVLLGMQAPLIIANAEVITAALPARLTAADQR
jgi:hypothetical protein